MKTLILTITFFIFSDYLSAQTLVNTIDFTYDATGNRISRSCPSVVVLKRSKHNPYIDKIIEPNSLSDSIFLTVSKLSIYPNPTTNIIKIDVTNFNNIKDKNSVHLYNEQGSQMYLGRLDASNNLIDVSSFASGLYYLKIITDFQTETYSIIKL